MRSVTRGKLGKLVSVCLGFYLVLLFNSSMRIADVITEMLDAPTMSRLLKLVITKYKGQLQFNASGVGSFTMLEVANRLNLEVERAKTVPCCLDIQETCPVPPPYT